MPVRLPDDFLKKVARALEEEEVDVYALTLYSMHADDMEYFHGKDRGAVEHIFRALPEDTRRHIDLLKLIMELGSK